MALDDGGRMQQSGGDGRNRCGELLVLVLVSVP